MRHKTRAHIEPGAVKHNKIAASDGVLWLQYLFCPAAKLAIPRQLRLKNQAVAAAVV